MKMIIAAEIYPPESGGPATFIKRMEPVLAANQIDFNVITYADQDLVENGVIKIGRSKNLLFRYWRYFSALKKLAQTADLIFAQGPLASGLPAILVKKLTGVKVIIKVVGDVAWERARNNNWTDQTVDEFQAGKHSFKINWQKILRAWTVKNADLVITPSEYLKKIVSGWGISPEKIKVIYNSFEANPRSIEQLVAKQKLNLAGDIILSVGRLAPWKGFGTLIDLLPAWLMINNNFKLLIVGTGPEEENLKRQVRNLKLEDKVIFAGQVAQAEMPIYYAAADYFVLNSGYEGLSHTVLEALSHGLPAAVSNIGGNPEVITNGENGLLFEYNNQQQILDSIKQMWQDQALRQKLQHNAVNSLAKFSFDKMIEEYLITLRSE
ncbi:MAG: glycosyltransferase family 4 protein [Candidatus Komeilibacteria bacterium]|nr:glycosyltransferase family 4 protein [Candidatus Komeilibacteria bacterium]